MREKKILAIIEAKIDKVQKNEVRPKNGENPLSYYQRLLSLIRSKKLPKNYAVILEPNDISKRKRIYNTVHGARRDDQLLTKLELLCQQ
jgi:hypothetical protein